MNARSCVVHSVSKHVNKTWSFTLESMFILISNTHMQKCVCVCMYIYIYIYIYTHIYIYIYIYHNLCNVRLRLSLSSGLGEPALAAGKLLGLGLKGIRL